MAAPVSSVRSRARTTGGRVGSVPVQVAGVVVVGALGGAFLAGNDAEGFLWLSVTWGFWLAGTIWAFARRHLALPFLGLQVFMLISVLLPAGTAYLSDGVYLFGVRYTSGIVDGLRMVALAQAGLTVGAMLVHLRPLDETPRHLSVRLPWRRVDQLSVRLAVLAVLGLVAFTVIAGVSLSRANVFAGDTNYGDLQEDTPGQQVKYFLVMQSLFGTAMVLATLRLTGSRSRNRIVPWIVLCSGTLFLAMGGQRQRLLVPVLACGLVWWKTSGSRFTSRLRFITVVAGVTLFAASAFINVLRNDYIQGQEAVESTDVFAVLGDQAGDRSNQFATTAGLAQNVPSELDFLHGESYLEIVVLPMPRAIWPEKPIGKMPELQNNFFDSRAGASFAEYGEMYANFGYVGVVVGCLLFGALIQYVWVRFERATSFESLIWLSVVIPVALLLFTRNYAAGIIAGQSGVFFGAWWTIWASRRWRRRGDTVDVELRG